MFCLVIVELLRVYFGTLLEIYAFLYTLILSYVISFQGLRFVLVSCYRSNIKKNKTVTMQGWHLLSFGYLLLVHHVRLTAAATCIQGTNCQLPNCFCPTFKHPNFSDPKTIPQMVYFGFDDAVHGQVRGYACMFLCVCSGVTEGVCVYVCVAESVCVSASEGG